MARARGAAPPPHTCIPRGDLQAGEVVTWSGVSLTGAQESECSKARSRKTVNRDLRMARFGHGDGVASESERSITLCRVRSLRR